MARAPKHRSRRSVWAARACLTLAVFFSVALVVTCFYRWMAGDALEGSSRLDYGVHDGAVWLTYSKQQINWIVVERGGRYHPRWPDLLPRVRAEPDRLGGSYSAKLPLWIPATLSMLGFFWLRRFGDRVPRGACPACRYVVGITGATLCPECGHEIDREDSRPTT